MEMVLQDLEVSTRRHQMGRGPRAELRVGNSGPSLRVALAPTSQRSLGPTVTGGQRPVWGTRASQSHRDLSPPSAQYADRQVPEERRAGCPAPPPICAVST